ncbi:4-carboxymuconolactone decarboxylase [Mangrovactinospora gilvigrisea]|uniref:4-carboxymuconolactone decarboxylase n=1 Tax=Mangrovactinospora gilvigrisea TaxID=1428644 RepID=A0A1J7CG63_9ACTN|nr:carboxymuconolactone decarboxylase family protein [Mangrovactinospora gilvigrisea]OIV38650.1 4-carboxymuconolactone decarboxylase [Mangrovactinospora gilvigrisea]
MTGTNPRMAPDLVRRHAPKLADLTDDVLFADVWQRPDLAPRDRSLITVAALVALGRDAQLTGHLKRALDNGLSTAELAEAITHLAFYAGWPAAMSAINVLAQVTERHAGTPPPSDHRPS